jgi:hypothetical protein
VRADVVGATDAGSGQPAHPPLALQVTLDRRGQRCCHASRGGVLADAAVLPSDVLGDSPQVYGDEGGGIRCRRPLRSSARAAPRVGLALAAARFADRRSSRRRVLIS